MLVTFRVKNIVSVCVKKLLHFALMLLFASNVVTFRGNIHFASIVTFCGVTVVAFKHVKVLTCTLQVSSSSVGAGTSERLTLKTLENPMLR